MIVTLSMGAAADASAEAMAAATRIDTIGLAVRGHPSVRVELAWPGTGEPRGAILFSHGANAAPDRYRALTTRWAAGGYLVASPLHLDSEDRPARDIEGRGRVLRSRIAEMEAVRAALADGRIAPPLTDRPMIAAGHSYGGAIAQVVAGAGIIDPGTGALLRAERAGAVAAVVALSPPPCAPGFMPPECFEDMTAPMLVQTGTADVMPPFVTTWEQHLDSHHAAAGPGWAAIYDGADHYIGGTIGRPDAAVSEAARDQCGRFADLALSFIAHTTGRATADAFERDLATLADRHLRK